MRLIGDLEAAESRVGRGQNAPFGLIRVTLAPVFGELHVVPRLAEFFARYPDITVEIVVNDRTVDMVAEGIELAIHNGALRDSTLIARRIATTPVITVASPAYLAAHGVPTAPGGLDRHRCILFALQGEPRPWGFTGPRGPIVYRPNGVLRTNDAAQIRAAVLAGLGLAHAPGWLFAREIEAGGVRRIMRDHEPAPLPISAVHPTGRLLATKVRVFMEFLAAVFATSRAWHWRARTQARRGTGPRA